MPRGVRRSTGGCGRAFYQGAEEEAARSGRPLDELGSRGSWRTTPATSRRQASRTDGGRAPARRSLYPIPGRRVHTSPIGRETRTRVPAQRGFRDGPDTTVRDGVRRRRRDARRVRYPPRAASKSGAKASIRIPVRGVLRGHEALFTLRHGQPVDERPLHVLRGHATRNIGVTRPSPCALALGPGSAGKNSSSWCVDAPSTYVRH